jgi:hypothetical protein
MPIDGGLGITPESPEWDCIESIFPLRDREFNEAWVRSWKPKQLASVSVREIREEVRFSPRFPLLATLADDPVPSLATV